MKPTKPSDFRSMSDTELQHTMVQNEQSLVDMRFKQALGELENSAAFKTIRRDIARIKTILREREIKAAASAE